MNNPLTYLNLKHDTVGVFGALDTVWIGRLLLTLILSGVVGLERSTHERASGLRTHILVGLGACLITIAGACGFAELHSAAGDRDPFRLATYVVSGIGFLGAGAIMRHGTTVRGLTTAASVWNVAGIGIAVGSGLGGLAILSVGLILFVLGPLQKWESRLRIGSLPGDLLIHLRDEGKAVGRTLARLASLGVGVRRATILPGAGTGVLLRVEIAVAPRQQDLASIVKALMDSPDVERVDTPEQRRTGVEAPVSAVRVGKKKASGRAPTDAPAKGIVRKAKWVREAQSATRSGKAGRRAEGKGAKPVDPVVPLMSPPPIAPVAEPADKAACEEEIGA